MKRDEELHSQLMTAFNNYFKENQKWISKGTRRSGIATRYWLSEIRRICSLRRIHIKEWRHELDEIKAEKKQLQKQQGTLPASDT